MIKFIKKIKKNEEYLEAELETGGTATIFLPFIFKVKAKNRSKTRIELFRKKKKYPSFIIDFLDDELLAEAFEGRKLKITIEVEE